MNKTLRTSPEVESIIADYIQKHNTSFNQAVCNLLIQGKQAYEKGKQLYTSNKILKQQNTELLERLNEMSEDIKEIKDILSNMSQK